MARIGIYEMGTSHVVQFTMRINRVDIEPEQQIESDSRIVAVAVGNSRETDPERVELYVPDLEKWGVQVVETAEELMEVSDGIIIATQHGKTHLEKARPFLEAGRLVYVDKPCTCSLADAIAMRDLAEANHTKVFSTSPLRYVPQIEAAIADEEEIGQIMGADTFGPSALREDNPGLYNYGMHGVEMLYALLGPGCVELSCLVEEKSEVVHGRWNDGRLGSVRGIHSGRSCYGMAVWGEKGPRVERVDESMMYPETAKRVTKFFETGESPLDFNITVEIMGFIEAAIKSGEQGGAVVPLGFTAS